MIQTINSESQFDEDESSYGISCHDVSKVFSGNLVLNRINLTVPLGSFCTIVGPSGCGKTTLLRAVGGLTNIDSGSISIHGTPVHGPSPKSAFVFQNFGLFPWKTLYENIAFGLKVQNASSAKVRERAEYFIDLVGLRGAENRYPYQVSGGMQQRAGLARAFAVQPEVLLMDEPFAAIDAQTRENLHEELLRIWEMHRCSVLFVTHSIEEAVLLSDNVIIMASSPGRILEALPIDLPRPRSSEKTRSSPEFEALRRHIWEMLHTSNKTNHPLENYSSGTGVRNES